MVRKVSLCFLAVMTVNLTSLSWALNGEVWNQLNPSGTPPSPRQSYTAVVDSRNHRMIMFGGWNNGTIYNDVWALDLTSGSEAWSQLATTGTPPSTRSSQTGFYDPINNQLIITCGSSSTEPLYDTWTLSLDSLKWTRLFIAGPDRRWASAGVYDFQGNRPILFGGLDFQVFPNNETYSLTLQPGQEQWKIFNSTGNPPSRRSSMASAYNPKNSKMIVFGGYYYDSNSGSDYFYNDTYLFDPNQGQGVWTQLSPGGNLPSQRREVSGVCDTLNNRFTIFGGGTRTSAYNDVYALDLTTNTWTQLTPSGTPPAPRYATQVVYDAPNQRMILFGGGSQGGNIYNDCWELSLPKLFVEGGNRNALVGHETPIVYPNPMGKEVYFNFGVNGTSSVNLKIFDVSGRLVRTLSQDFKTSGTYRLTWDGNSEKGVACPSGVYFYEWREGGQTAKGKIVKTR